MFDIICPYCMKRFKGNNVVFRHGEEGLRSLNLDVNAFSAEDPYLHAFEENHGRGTAMKRQLPKVVDPAFLPESSKEYSVDGDLLLSVNCGYRLDDRLCPFCHNRLFQGAGRAPVQMVSIIGDTHSGKTTFEAAMIRQMRMDGVGCFNQTLKPNGDSDNSVERNITTIVAGNPETLGNRLEEVTWGATNGYHGPYIYNVGRSGLQPASLVFYDLPGEALRERPTEVRRMATYIGTAQTCLLLIDLDAIGSVSSTIATLQTQFEQDLRRNQVNVAIVLYKVDQLYKKVEVNSGVSGLVPRPISFRDCEKRGVDFLEQVNLDSEKIHNFIVMNNSELESAYNGIEGLVGENRIRFFVAQSFNEEGKFAPAGCDIPVLWTLRKQGLV